MASRISKCSIVAAGKDQACRDLGGDLIILNFNSGMYYALDSVGVRIWELIQTPITVEGIRDAIVEEYDVDSDSCTNDLIALCQKLVDKGLIVVMEDEAST